MIMTREQQQARDRKLAKEEQDTQETLGRIEGLEAYENTTEKQKSIIAFGMTPIELFPTESFYDADTQNPNYKKGFSIGLMQAAKTFGKMIV